jgi:CRISPR-associated protein Cmr5
MSELRNLNLEVAKFALECVEEVIKYDEENKKRKFIPISKEYKTISKKMTTLIQKNGLIGAMVFILSKVKEENEKEKKQNNSHYFILLDMMNWSDRSSKLEVLKKKLSVGDKKSKESFISKVTELSNQEYRLLTKEMMNLFGWIKRFSDGMIEGEDGNDQTRESE